MGAKIHEGHLVGTGLRVAIVASRFNAFVVDRLIEGALDALRRTGCDEEAVEVFRSPGSFEIPQIAKRLADSSRFDAVICLGAVIRGGTPHFEYVAAEAAKGIAQVAMSAPVPVTFGVLTTDTVEQAIERAGTKAGNKGFDAALAALELCGLYREMAGGAPGARKSRR